MQEGEHGFKSLETFSSIVCVGINVLHLFIFHICPVTFKGNSGHGINSFIWTATITY